jgi:crotonobetainyl-CoA:carnitine CoA-transferase CaiB-like acyl-CoA transferase
MGLTLLGASLVDSEPLEHQSHTGVQNPVVITYRTSDGRFIPMVFLQPHRYQPEFYLTVDKEEWLADEWFIDAARRQNTEACTAMLDECARSCRDKRAVGHPRNPGRALIDPDPSANGYIHRVDEDGGRVITPVTAPVQFDQEAATPSRAPRPGADTRRHPRRHGIGGRRGG